MSLAVGRALDATAFALATAAGIAVGYVAILVKRRRVSSDDEVAAKIIKTPEPPGFSLLTELLDDDAFLELIRLLPALSSARLARINKSAHARISEPDVALWCAESRKQRLAKRNVAGDLPLAYTDEAKWTLERLHLCEHPPRFPQVLFKFASDAIEDGTGPHSEIARVASILRKHPTLRVRIHGYAQPDAPPQLGEALAQARATSVRHALLLQLADVPEFADEDPTRVVRAASLSMQAPPLSRSTHAFHLCVPLSVRPDRNLVAWSPSLPMRHTRIIGHKLQALGRWGHSPRNHNYEHATPPSAVLEGDWDDTAEVVDATSDEEEEDPAGSASEQSDDEEDDEDDDDEEEEQSDSDDEYGGRDKLRRAEFTLLALE